MLEEVKLKAISIESKSLLDEFKDIIVDEFPKELYPVRNISHQI